MRELFIALCVVVCAGVGALCMIYIGISVFNETMALYMRVLGRRASIKIGRKRIERYCRYLSRIDQFLDSEGLE